MVDKQREYTRKQWTWNTRNYQANKLSNDCDEAKVLSYRIGKKQMNHGMVLVKTLNIVVNQLTDMVHNINLQIKITKCNVHILHVCIIKLKETIWRN